MRTIKWKIHYALSSHIPFVVIIANDCVCVQNYVSQSQPWIRLGYAGKHWIIAGVPWVKLGNAGKLGFPKIPGNGWEMLFSRLGNL